MRSHVAVSDWVLGYLKDQECLQLLGEIAIGLHEEGALIVVEAVLAEGEQRMHLKEVTEQQMIVRYTLFYTFMLEAMGLVVKHMAIIVDEEGAINLLQAWVACK